MCEVTRGLDDACECSKEQQVRYKGGKRECDINVVWDLITSPDVTYTSIVTREAGANLETLKWGCTIC